MKKEEWREIPGYDGAYEVSNLGRVRSWKKPGSWAKAKNPRVLKPYYGKKKSSSRYPLVALSKSSKTRTYAVHRLVAKAFLGSPPPNKTYVLHKDDNPLHNRVENLYWGSQLENRKDCRKNGNQPLGEDIKGSKLTRDDVKYIRSRYKKGGVTLQELGDRFGVAFQTIGRIVNRKDWRHV